MASTGPTERPRAAGRWRTVGLVGSTAMAVAATGVGALPATGALGSWTALPWSRPGAWPAVILAYLGLTLLVGAWWQLRGVLSEIPDRLSFVLRTLVLWSLPLAIAPPLFSRDLYSYVAQGTMNSIGMDVYHLGPAALAGALPAGVGGALAANVSAVWQSAPAPYGPVFLGLASLVTTAAGPHIVAAVIGMRLLMIGALAVTTACLIPLARRFRVDPAHAVWLAMLNPLMLAHVVSGAHNDILILMLMMAGVLLAVREHPIVAAVVLGLAILIKVPAAAAIIVVVPSMARQLHGRYRMARAGVMVGSASLATVLVVTWLMGTGYGWVGALTDTARVRNGMSITTDLGMIVDSLAGTVGANQGPIDAVSVTRALGVVVAAALIWMLAKGMRGRPLFALGLIMSAVVVLGPVVHPWYLLWGIVPLAASTRDNRVIGAVAAISAAVAFYPMPWGEGFTTDLIWGVLGAAVGLLVLRAALGLPEAPPVLVSPEPQRRQTAGSRSGA